MNQAIPRSRQGRLGCFLALATAQACVLTVIGALIAIPGHAQSGKPASIKAPPSAPANPVTPGVRYGPGQVVPPSSATAPDLVAKISSPLDDIRLLATSAFNQQAVVLLPGEHMQAIQVGDTVPGTQARLRKVLVDKVVFEEAYGGKSGKQIVTLGKTVGTVPGSLQRLLPGVEKHREADVPKRIVIHTKVVGPENGPRISAQKPP